MIQLTPDQRERIACGYRGSDRNCQPVRPGDLLIKSTIEDMSVWLTFSHRAWCPSDGRRNGRAGSRERSPGRSRAGKTAPDLSGLHDFDFLIGDWRVHSRRLKERLAGSDEWSQPSSGNGSAKACRNYAAAVHVYTGRSIRPSW